MCQHHVDVVRSAVGAFTHPHTLCAIHGLAASAIGRVPGFDKLRAFPGCALPVPDVSPNEPGSGDDDGAGQGRDYDHMAGAVLGRVLRMRPPMWRRAGELARLDPDDEELRYLLMAVQMVQSELPTPLLMRCRREQRSPIDVWTDIADAERRRVAEGQRGAVIIALDGLMAVPCASAR